MKAEAATNGAGTVPASATVPKMSGMVIQTIPPFKGSKAKAGAPDVKVAPPQAAATQQQPLSPTSQQRLNINATAFRPNPKAASFTPVVVRGASGSDVISFD